MLCTFCLESKVPRIAGPGLVGAGHPALTQVLDVPTVPRVGEEVFLVDAAQRTRHTVMRVYYLVSKDTMQGAMVLVSDGKPIDD